MVDVLNAYLRQRNRLRREVCLSALLVSNVGTRLDYRYVNKTFGQLAERAGLVPRSPSCRPRPHSLRHGFAVHAETRWYRDGGDVQVRLPLLSTYSATSNPPTLTGRMSRVL